MRYESAMKEADMQVWQFSGADGLGALTSDETGLNLPADHGPWRSVAALLIHEIMTMHKRPGA
jgi:hypothetical protein